MPKANKQVIIDEIMNEMKLGKKYSEVLAINGGKWRLTDRTFQRYWSTAISQLSDEQEEIKKELLKLDKEAAIESRKKQIMQADERKVYLTKLIQGKVKVPYSEVRWNPNTKKFETIKFVELPNPQSRIAAIAELNKMEGDYAPTKTELTGKDGKPLEVSNTNKLDYSKFTDEELITLKMLHDKAAQH